MIQHVLVVLAIVVVMLALHRLLHRSALRHVLANKQKAKRPRQPAVLHPKSERDCPDCRAGWTQPTGAKGATPVAWRERRGRGGRKKRLSTAGYFCPNQACAYYGLTDAQLHALVGDGTDGQQEVLQDFKCQACGKKVTARRQTVLYRLKSQSELVAKILWLLALGVDASALEEVFGVRETTIRTWLSRSGQQGQKLHERFLVELVHVQLDELWTNVKAGGQAIWLWVAMDAKTKLIPVLQVGGRTQARAYGVVHELQGRLRAGCVPVFSTDGLRFYYYALTAHFGQWAWADGKRLVWVLLGELVDGQVIKHRRKYRIVEVERRILCGEEKQYRARLQAAGLSGRINTAFGERVNLTIRQCVSKLTRRTWRPAKYTPELLEHLEWWRSYYHSVRPLESLAMELSTPILRQGNEQPAKYRRRTPAMTGIPNGGRA